MKYDKQPLLFDEQADLLLRRGMAGDRDIMIRRLRQVSYYRLSGYAFPFRVPAATRTDQRDTQFAPGTTFQAVWNRYAFDRRLRLLLLDAIERIEIAVRSLLATHHAMRFGTFGYADSPTSLPELRQADRPKFTEKLRDEQARSKDVFAGHFRAKYGDLHPYLPIWMAAEVLSMGTLLTLYRSCGRDVRQAVADEFGVHEVVFASWLLTLNTIRNACAHHGRVWNREFGTKPKIPRRQPEWHSPVEIRGDRVFAVLTICKWCLDRIAPQSRWPCRLYALLAEFSEVPTLSMGFPPTWESSAIWRQSMVEQPRSSRSRE